MKIKKILFFSLIILTFQYCFLIFKNGVSLVLKNTLSPNSKIQELFIGTKKELEICKIFKKFNVIPSYTLKQGFNDFLSVENNSIKSLAQNFESFFEKSSVYNPFSIEIDLPTTTLSKILIQNSDISFFNKNYTYHLRKIGNNVLNLARSDFEDIINSEDAQKELSLIISKLNPKFISIHLGWAAEEIDLGVVDGHDVALSPKLESDILLKRFLNNILLLKKKLEQFGYKKPILIETLDFYQKDAKGAYDFITDPKFINSLFDEVNSEKINLKLLIDCGHLLVSAKNKPDYNKKEFMEYVREVVNDKTINLIEELHVVVPVIKPEKEIDRYVDIHQPLYIKTIASKEVKEILLYIFNLRKKHGIKKQIIVNFETGIANFTKEIPLLSQILNSTVLEDNSISISS